MDKVQNLLVPTSPNPMQKNEQKFFDDVNEKLEKVEEDRNRKESENEKQKTLNVETQNKNVGETKTEKHVTSERVVHDEVKNENENSTSETKEESKDKKDKKLVRQDSVHSISESRKMSNEIEPNTNSPRVPHAPMLQHFHPLLSGPKLETIPSLPETSLDHSQSIDTDGICDNDKCESSDTNQASV